MPEKFIGYFRLIDNCGRPGCPVCRSVMAESRHYLDALIDEQVTDPETRRGLRASWGFCNWHAWMLLEIENSLSGAAIIYEDVLGGVIDRVRRSAARVRPETLDRWRPWRRRKAWRAITEPYHGRQVCSACVNTTAAEDRYLQTLVSFVNEPDLQLAYARSDGLCVPHAIRAVEIGPGADDVRELLDRTLPKWARFRQDLESFIRKHDYRNTAPYTDAELDSCRRAFETLTGVEGLFGNDLHPVADAVKRQPARVREKPAVDARINRAERTHDGETERNDKRRCH
jgi:Family of unknown function (DUF6062)